MKYTFNVKKCSSWQEDYDTTIHFEDEDGSDDIGKHSEDLMKHLRPIGIFYEEMENVFGFDFTPTIPNKKALINYLEGCGMARDKRLNFYG